ncbi:hypothetical protein Taro_007638 [Colocasia esculenta]|uniref:Uncharacterized protein n=1 Tax=Colocasia esculenta TaxID=4460 RepID=A0A843TUQ6_COLES|nr:hypothetical protein [Colocasia esculenta]
MCVDALSVSSTYSSLDELHASTSCVTCVDAHVHLQWVVGPPGHLHRYGPVDTGKNMDVLNRWLIYLWFFCLSRWSKSGLSDHNTFCCFPGFSTPSCRKLGCYDDGEGMNALLEKEPLPEKRIGRRCAVSHKQVIALPRENDFNMNSILSLLQSRKMFKNNAYFEPFELSSGVKHPKQVEMPRRINLRIKYGTEEFRHHKVYKTKCEE